VIRLRILMRVNACPFPGLTNWKSMTVYGAPSSMILRFLRMSDVSMKHTRKKRGSGPCPHAAGRQGYHMPSLPSTIVG